MPPRTPKPPKLEDKKQEKLSMNQLRNIKYKYYDELRHSYDQFLGREPPDFTLVREPRIFKQKDGKIIGYEKLDEYLDNNHPLWTEDRITFSYFIHGRYDNRMVADFIREKWNSGLHIDLCQNLTSIPRLECCFFTTHVKVFIYNHSMQNKDGNRP